MFGIFIKLIYVVLFIYFYFLRKTTLYQITDSGIIINSGFFIKKETLIPYSDLISIKIDNNIIEKKMGIFNLYIYYKNPNPIFNVNELIKFKGILEPNKPKEIIEYYISQNIKN